MTAHKALALDGPLRGQIIDMPRSGPYVHVHSIGTNLLTDDAVFEQGDAVFEQIAYYPQRFIAFNRSVMMASCRPEPPSNDELIGLILSPDARKVCSGEPWLAGSERVTAWLR